MRDSYSNLCMFNFGKRSYAVIKNNDKVVYFEVVDGKYVMPITNFNLMDNQGKSLTSVNHHFFMSQLVNRVNFFLSKGYFRSDRELIDYLNNIKNNLEGSSSLKNLFKGSLMGEINEENFEKNKKEILKCLDEYKIDTFVDYNNVSIFDGSLDKNDNSVSDNMDSSLNSFDFSQNSGNDLNNVSDSIGSVDYFSSLGNQSNQSDQVMNMDDSFDFSNVSDVNESVGLQSVDNALNQDQSSVSSQGSNVENVFDFGNTVQGDMNVNSVSNNQNVSFNNVQGEVQNNAFSNLESVNNVFDFGNTVQDNMNVNSVSNNQNVSFNNVQGEVQNNAFSDLESVNNVFDFGNTVQDDMNVNPVSNNQNVSLNNVQGEVQNNAFSDLKSVDNSSISSSDSIEFNGILNDISNSNVNNVSSNELVNNLHSSYINEVKDRIESVNGNSFEPVSFIPNENVEINNTVQDNKIDLPELESIASEEISNDSSNKKENGGNKNKVGVVVFMIILIVLLVVASYLLYNYVF